MRRLLCCLLALGVLSSGFSGQAADAEPLAHPNDPVAAGPLARTAEPDFNGDGFADLAAGGGPHPTLEGTLGALHVLYGSPAGLGKLRSQRFLSEDFGSPQESSFGSPLATGHFDGDRYTDLAVGSHAATVGSVREAGSVRILYGSSQGLTHLRSQQWSQATPGVAGSPEWEDSFGIALAVGNFGHGAQDDLAIGVRFENNREGAVHVLYGSSSGLTAAGSQMWTEKSPGVRGKAESGDLFGSAFAAGNFGRGDYDDLAIGVIDDYLSGHISAGSVTVMYGSGAGLTASGSQRWTQNSRGIPGTVEDEEYFGQALTAARFTGSRYDDLAIGVPGENNYTGAVNVIYGSSRGLTRRNAQILSQATRGVAGKAESGDVFGVALVGGVFGRDRNGSYDDLAIGVPGESLGRIQSAGSVQIIYGSKQGLDPARDQTIHQGQRGILGAVGRGDEFGWFLARGSFDGRPGVDLAIGSQGEQSFNVLYGSSGGFGTDRNQLWTKRGFILPSQ